MRSFALTSLVALTLTVSAAAEGSLTDYNGAWTGEGQDRDTPLQSLQPTQCRARVNNDASHMTRTIVCNGTEGLHKRMQVTLAFDGGTYSGTTEQSSSSPSREPVRRAGKVSGDGSVEIANLIVSFPGLLPSATVVIRGRTSPSTFAMKVTTFSGATLTDGPVPPPLTAGETLGQGTSTVNNTRYPIVLMETFGIHARCC